MELLCDTFLHLHLWDDLQLNGQRSRLMRQVGLHCLVLGQLVLSWVVLRCAGLSSVLLHYSALWYVERLSIVLPCLSLPCPSLPCPAPPYLALPFAIPCQ